MDSSNIPRYYVSYKIYNGVYFAQSSIGTTYTVPKYESCYKELDDAEHVAAYMNDNKRYGYNDVTIVTCYPDNTNNTKERRIIVNSEDNTKPSTQVVLLAPHGDSYRLVAFFPDAAKALAAADAQGLTKVMIAAVTDIKTYTRDGWKAS